MPRRSDPRSRSPESESGPRAVLRVPDVLMALAAAPEGRSLAELAPRLKVPKTSLHRLLRTLERGGYLTEKGAVYRLGPTSFQLASLIGRSAPPSAFPGCARSTLEELARETGETVMLGVPAGDEPEVLYVDVIESEAPIRFTLAIGDRRPLYSAASGKAVLAYMPADEQSRYLATTDFTRFTPETSSRQEMPSVLEDVGRSGIAFDDSGKVSGASGIASPIFDPDGKVLGAVSVAGPSERIAARRQDLEGLVRRAGERISQLVGYDGAYPPRR